MNEFTQYTVHYTVHLKNTYTNFTKMPKGYYKITNLVNCTIMYLLKKNGALVLEGNVTVDDHLFP